MSLRRALLPTLIRAAVIVVMLFPIYWLVLTSLKPGALVQTSPPVFSTTELTLSSFDELLARKPVVAFFLNSTIVAFGSTVIAVVFGSMAAFVLSKTFLALRLRRAILLWVLLTRIFPPVVLVIPYFTILRDLGLVDTHVGLILTHVGYTLPLVIWLMLGFFAELPNELDRAAVLDGCSLWRRFWRISMPLVLPGLAVAAIFAFIFSWNEYLFASILTAETSQTLPVAMSSFVGQLQQQWGPMSALGVLMLIPVAVLALAAQRYIVQGLTFGAVKE